MSPQQATTRPHGQQNGDLLLEPSTSCQKLNMFKSWQQVARTRFSTKKKRSTCRQQRATRWTNLQQVASNRQLVARNKQLVEATGNKLLILSTCWTNWQLVASNKQQVAHSFNLLPAISNLSPVNKLLSTSRQCGQGFTKIVHNVNRSINQPRN